jgi:hypothetical protein
MVSLCCVLLCWGGRWRARSSTHTLGAPDSRAAAPHTHAPRTAAPHCHRTPSRCSFVTPTRVPASCKARWPSSQVQRAA